MTESSGEKGTREIVYVPAPGYGYDAQDEIDLLDLWEIVWRGKWFIVGVTALCTMVAALVSLYLMTPKYKATMTIAPTQQSKSIIRNYLSSNTFHRQLIEKYDLLPKIFPGRWDEKSESWMVEDDEMIPTVEQVLVSESGFPLKVSGGESTISVSWIGSDPEFSATMLDRVLTEMRTYLQEEYVTSAQERVTVLKDELKSLQAVARESKNVESEVLSSLAGLQSKVADLRAEDVLSRRFSLIDEPLPPQSPFEPNKKLITALAFVLGLFVSVFLVFFHRFVHNAKQRYREKESGNVYAR